MKKVKRKSIQFDPNNITDVEPMQEQPINTEFAGEELSEENSGHLENANEVDLGDVEKEVENHSNSTGGENNTEAETVEAETVTDEKVDEKTMALNGEFLLFMIDTAFPVVIKYGTEAVNKKVTVQLDALKLDYEEKELLRPSANEVATLLFGKMSPVQQFLLGLSVIYTSKVPNAIKDK